MVVIAQLPPGPKAPLPNDWDCGYLEETPPAGTREDLIAKIEKERRNDWDCGYDTEWRTL